MQSLLSIIIDSGQAIEWSVSNFVITPLHPQATFSAPKGSGPLVLDLSSMGKGQAWVNGQSIGRYWPAYLSPMTGCGDNCDYRGTYSASKCQKNCGHPSQTL